MTIDVKSLGPLVARAANLERLATLGKLNLDELQAAENEVWQMGEAHRAFIAEYPDAASYQRAAPDPGTFLKRDGEYRRVLLAYDKIDDVRANLFGIIQTTYGFDR